MGDVEHCEPFRHYHGVKINVSVSEAPVDILRARPLLEEIFSGFERTAAVKIVPENERIFAPNDAGALQFGSDTPCGVSRAQHDEGLTCRGDRGEQRPGKPAGTG